MPLEQPSPESQPNQESQRSIEEIDTKTENIKQQKEEAKENDELQKALGLKQQLSALKDEREEKLLSAQEEAGQINERIDEIDEQINEKEAQKEAAKEADELEEALRLQNEIEDLEKEKEQLVNGSAETVANENTQESTPGPPESQESPADVEKNEEAQESLSDNEDEPIETEEERQEKINNIRAELGMEVEETPSKAESAESGVENQIDEYIHNVAVEYNDIRKEYAELKEKRNLQDGERERLIQVEKKFRDLREEILETTSGMSSDEIEGLRDKNSGFRNDRLRAAMNEVLGTDLPVMSEDLITKEVEGYDQLYVDYKELSNSHREEAEETQENKSRLAEARYDFFDKMQEAVHEVNQLSEEQREEIRASDEYKMLVDVLGAGGDSSVRAIEDVYATVASTLDTMSDASSPISVHERDYPDDIIKKLDEKYNSSPRDMEEFMKGKTGGALRRMALHKVAKQKGYIE